MSTYEQAKEKAKNAFQNNDIKGAVALYEKCLNMNGAEVHLIHSNLAACHLRLGQNKDALKSAIASIVSDKTWFKGYIRKAEALYRLKKLEECEQTMIEGILMGNDPAILQPVNWDAQMINDIGEYKLMGSTSNTTLPNTIAFGLRSFLTAGGNFTKPISSNGPFRIDLIGASDHAEGQASFSLLACNVVRLLRSNNIIETSASNTPFELDLLLVGFNEGRPTADLRENISSSVSKAVRLPSNSSGPIKLSVTTHVGFYHDLFKDPNNLPHFAVLSCSGFMSKLAFKSWYPTLQLLLDANVPILATGYSRVTDWSTDSEQVEDVLKWLGAKVYVSLRRNLFIKKTGLMAKDAFIIVFQGRDPELTALSADQIFSRLVEFHR